LFIWFQDVHILYEKKNGCPIQFQFVSFLSQIINCSRFRISVQTRQMNETRSNVRIAFWMKLINTTIRDHNIYSRDAFAPPLPPTPRRSYYSHRWGITPRRKSYSIAWSSLIWVGTPPIGLLTNCVCACTCAI